MNYTSFRMIIMQGMSGSGKSTFAQALKKTYGEKIVIVSRDDIRKRLLSPSDLERYFEGGLDYNLEDHITTLEQEEIARGLAKNATVIVDNTNLRKKYVIEYLKLALDFGCHKSDILLKRMDVVDVEEALKRIQERNERFVSADILQAQRDSFLGAKWTLSDCFVDLREYMPKTWFVPKFPIVPYVPDDSKPKAIICDLDGTLAHRSIITYPHAFLRSFYAYDLCETDAVDPLVSSIIQGLATQGTKIIFLSGRKNDCRKETLSFIRRVFPEDSITLLMRDPEIDKIDGRDAPDDVVKYRLFNENLRDQYNIIGAIDDRKRVLALWETLGIKTLNVGKLNEVF